MNGHPIQVVIGIDPGRAGALCIFPIGAHDPILHVMPPSIHETADILERYPTAHVFMERAQAMPKNGAVSMFNYGTGYGEILGAIAAFKMEHTLVRPATWAKEMHANAKGGVAKARSLEVVRRLFPWVDLKATERSKTPHLGLVDALLISEYGRRVLVWETSRKRAGA